MDGSEDDTASPQIVAATAASTLQEGVEVLKTLLQQEDWEKVPEGLEHDYNAYVQTQAAQGKQYLGSHKWYITERLLPSKLEGILRTMHSHWNQL